jgi:hypothetical protein
VRVTTAQIDLIGAQVDGLGPARYDVCISCFGVLFRARTWIITARTPRRQRGRAPDIEDPGRTGQDRANPGPPPDTG